MVIGMPWGRGWGWRGRGWGARLGYCPWTGLPRGWRWFYPYWGYYAQSYAGYGQYPTYWHPLYGTAYQADVRTEIEDLKRRIAELTEKLRRLGGQ